MSMLHRPRRRRQAALALPPAPFTVVLVPDDSRAGRVQDIEAKTFVAHVIAASHTAAYVAGLNAAAESGTGPAEPIDWAVVFLCRGHIANEAEKRI